MALHEDLLILLAWLRSHPSATVPQVAAHFGYTETQVRQYIMLLSCTGTKDAHNYLIDINYEGDHINVYDTLTVDRPFRFDSMEAACLIAGIDALGQTPMAALGLSAAAVQSARAKLNELLVDEVRLRVVPAEREFDADAEQQIAAALKTGKRLTFKYWNVARDDFQQRVVSPLRLRAVEQEPVLDAYCHTHLGWRSFQLGRMHDVDVSGVASELPSAEFEAMPTSRVVVSVPAVAQHLLENLPVRSQQPRADGRVEAVVEVAVPEWLARQVLASGRRIQVEAPVEFVREVQDLVAAAELAYQNR